MIDILGTKYDVICSNEVDTPRMKGYDGLCDTSSKQIYVTDCAHVCEDNPALKCSNVRMVIERVLLHEIIHAFLYESGLDANSGIASEGWANNEEMVDWFAIQYFKIGEAYKAGLVDIEKRLEEIQKLQ